MVDEYEGIGFAKVHCVLSKCFYIMDKISRENHVKDRQVGLVEKYWWDNWRRFANNELVESSMGIVYKIKLN